VESLPANDRDLSEIEKCLSLGVEKFLGSPPSYPGVVAVPTWGHPISNKGYVIGFVDMLAPYFRPTLEVTGFYTDWNDNRLVGQRLNASNVLPGWGIRHDDRRSVCFEVKSKITSLGDLIRQIHLYQEYIKAPFVVVSPDIRFANALRGQGIHFLPYDAPP
jgi:hypothetical protein